MGVLIVGVDAFGGLLSSWRLGASGSSYYVSLVRSGVCHPVLGSASFCWSGSGEIKTL
jgi:hypothetical protein